MKNPMRKGWRRDKRDRRDYMLSHAVMQTGDLPGAVDLSSKMPPIWDQGESSSCTAHAAAAALQYAAKRSDPFSRLMIYWNTREIEGDADLDEGAEIRNALKAVSKFGACDEKFWPFDLKRLFSKPDRSAYGNAGKLADYAKLYWRVPQSIDEMKSLIAAGLPFMFGFDVFESFESNSVAESGIMPMPKKDENTSGGHAVLAVGYDDSSRAFIIRNSWGKDWGRNGHFLMPYDFIRNPNVCDDFWVIKSVGIS